MEPTIITRSDQAKSRDLFLLIMLLINAIGILFGVINLLRVLLVFGFTVSLSGYGLSNSMNLLYALLHDVILLITLIAIWKWKKWGVYSYTLVSILTSLVTIYTMLKLGPSIFITQIPIFLTILILTLWSIRRKWNYFE